MTSTVASAIRPSLRDNRQLSGSPHTPNRFISSNYSSPGSSFRQEEDAIIFELDTRGLKAGFEGESGPQCELRFGPETSRRVGDFRAWLPGYQRREQNIEYWSTEYELWRTDLKDVDLGLVEDKLERAVREAYNKYLLTDAGNARLVLVLPSLVPHPVLSSLLTLLFERWKYTTITLLPSPTMATVAAGLRSALVIDIGWEETCVTPIYEYRELPSLRTTRGMRLLNAKVSEMLKEIRQAQSGPEEKPLLLNFDLGEELMTRILSCGEASNDTKGLAIAGSQEASDSHITIDWPTNGSSRAIQISTSKISEVLCEALLDNPPDHYLDDHEQVVPDIVYKALLSLLPDVRSSCMSRVVFIGQGSRILELRRGIMKNVEALIQSYGWSAIRGKHVDSKRTRLSDMAQGRTVPVDVRYDTALPHGKDYVEERLQKQRAKEAQQNIHGELREVETLGPWAGASLLASLKIRGFVEIERERFLSHGLTGANRDGEMSVLSNRMSSFGVASAKPGDKAGWNLAGWG